MTAPAWPKLLTEVRRALRGLALTPADSAAGRLAVHYATMIDSAEDGHRAEVLAEFGPKLLTVLTALGATPAARAGKGAPGVSPVSALESLRARRAARLDPAAAVDPTPS